MKLELELPDGAVTVTAAPPELVSQKTSEATLGIPRRPFLEALGGYQAAGGEVLKLGRLRLVRPADFVGWLARRRPAELAAPVSGADQLAAELGLVAVGGGR